MSFKFGFLKDIFQFGEEYEKNLKQYLKVLNWFHNLEKLDFNVNEYLDH